jgi:tetratricopeptide (TPR) repeat protein
MIPTNPLDERTTPSSPSAAPHDAAEWNQLGIARLGQGDPQGALDAFGEARRRDPGYTEAWNNSGLVRQMLGRLTESVADFDQALALRPAYPEALNNRGRALQGLGDEAGALGDFDRALACAGGPFATSVLHNRGALRQAMGDQKGALADFDRALEINPDQVCTRLSRATARKEAGDLNGALADVEQALRDLPADEAAAAYHCRGGIRALQNDFTGAVADYDRALALEPDNVCFYVSRGNARYHLRDRRGVIDYRMAFRLDPDSAASEVSRALTALDAADVLRNCDKHLRLNDRDALAYARRGLTLLLMGREVEAEADFARCRELVPDMAVCLYRVIERLRARVSAFELLFPSAHSDVFLPR